MFLVVFFFVKQKTAYEMRISDWSSDVCSSDLTVGEFERQYMDSYDQLLPIIRIPGESQAQDLAASMGTVISKASEMIDRHEVSKWTDNAYLMIGKANFYRYDFQNALTDRKSTRRNSSP